MQINYLKKLWTFTYLHQQNLSPFNMEINNFIISVWDHKKNQNKSKCIMGVLKKGNKLVSPTHPSHRLIGFIKNVHSYILDMPKHFWNPFSFFSYRMSINPSYSSRRQGRILNKAVPFYNQVCFVCISFSHWNIARPTRKYL